MNSNDSNSFVLQTIIFEGALAIIGAFLALLCGLDLWKAFQTNNSSELLCQLGLGLAISAGMCLFFTILDLIPLKCLKDVSEKTKDIVCETFKNTTRFNRFLVCMQAGIGEEILFRGFIFIVIFEYWPWGLEFNMNIIAAIAISSILFGLGHCVTLLYFFITGLMGVFFCLIFLWTGSLIAPIVAHGLYDFYAMETALKEDDA